MGDEQKPAEQSQQPADGNADVTQLVEKSKGKTLKEVLTTDALKIAVAQSLPRHLNAERFIRVSITALTRVKHLRECTYASFFKCLLDLSSVGLEPDGRNAHLIPFWNSKLNAYECTLILDYKGIVSLVRRSGELANIHCDVVYKGDEWGFAYGSGAFLKHTPALDGPRKERIAAYSFVKLKDGSEDFMVWGMTQVEGIHNRSKSPTKGPWVTDYDEMAKKSVFRNHSKWLPLSSELHELIERDDDNIALDTTGFEIEELGSREGARNVAAEKLAAMQKEDGLKPAGEILKEHQGAQANDATKDGDKPSAPAENSAQTEQPAAESTGKQESPSPELNARLMGLLKYKDRLTQPAVDALLKKHGVEDATAIAQDQYDAVSCDCEDAIKALPPEKVTQMKKKDKEPANPTLPLNLK